MLVGPQYVLGRDWLAVMNVLDEVILRKRMMNMAYTIRGLMN